MVTLTVKKGKHQFKPNKPRGLFLTSHNPKVKCCVSFDKSCRYRIKDDYISPINKLFGISLGYHQVNSARFGWSYNNHTKKIDIFAYGYKNGHRYYFKDKVLNADLPFLKVTSMDIDEVRCFEIKFNSWLSVFSYRILDKHEDNVYAYVTQHHDDAGGPIGYYLSPYFGGSLPAPHTMKLKLQINDMSLIKRILNWFNAAYTIHPTAAQILTASVVMIIAIGLSFFSDIAAVSVFAIWIVSFIVGTLYKFNKDDRGNSNGVSKSSEEEV